MQEQVSKILSDLKGIKIAASAVEKELGFANGQLGQAAKGKSRLSDERLAKLMAYYKTKVGGDKPEPQKDKTKDVPASLDQPKKESKDIGTIPSKREPYDPFKNSFANRALGTKTKE